jgi:RING finger protein 113A
MSDDAPVSFKKRKIKRDTVRTTDGGELAESAAEAAAQAQDDQPRPDGETEGADINQIPKRARPALANAAIGGSTRTTSSANDALAAPLGAVVSTFSAERDTARDRDATASEIDPITLDADRDRPKWMRSGPMRQSATISGITTYDHQPDICKDYRDSGRCRWGDTCKFMHDRGGYLSGAQVDADWNRKQAERAKQLAAGLEAAAAAEADAGATVPNPHKYPQMCSLCERPFRDPVMTLCRHYFCEDCALARFRTDPKCPQCGAPTNGIFNGADGLAAYLQQVAAARAKQAAARAAAPGSEAAAAASAAAAEHAERAERALQAETGAARQYEMGWKL